MITVCSKDKGQLSMARQFDDETQVVY